MINVISNGPVIKGSFKLRINVPGNFPEFSIQASILKIVTRSRGYVRTKLTDHVSIKN